MPSSAGCSSPWSAVPGTGCTRWSAMPTEKEGHGRRDLRPGREGQRAGQREGRREDRQGLPGRVGGRGRAGGRRPDEQRRGRAGRGRGIQDQGVRVQGRDHPGTPNGTTVPFKVEAEITYEGTTKPLAYDSQLTVVRGLTSGKPLVDWQPSVIHPQLQKDEKLRAGAPANPPVKAVDRNGEELTAEKYPRCARSWTSCARPTATRRAASPGPRCGSSRSPRRRPSGPC